MRSNSAAGARVLIGTVAAVVLALLLGACTSGGQTGAISVASGAAGPGEPPPSTPSAVSTSGDSVYGGAVRGTGGQPPRAAPTLAGGYPTAATLGQKARQKLKDEADALKHKAYFTMPKLVGVNLQTAQDTLQSHGSFLLDEVDATGAHRSQMLDRDWKVCSQAPKPGTRTAVIALVTLRSVKLSERCPRK